ncbi:hypothetical protein CIW83_21650 [Tissierella sp. P1]|jgi:hypothetical protein|uniref:hypothetical protein n=1 Tax=Tissierella TaxID=41273 RepID=UPI000B9FAEB9|nr:hypothetical protein [Tissierella sp. P1]MDU5079966.1 hypothetical protein [Bacillota bacterium]OZV10193.1 hypothetical protein CIW83_21650 [Tissierella sp. P1]
MDIKNDPIYQEETIKEKARLDEIERRKKLDEEKKKSEQNKNLIKYLIIGISFLIFLYITVYIPFSNMFK